MTKAVSGQQLVLDLRLPNSFTERDFVPAPGNHDALCWIRRWPDWISPVMVIYGSRASGRSHLAQIWAKRANAVVLHGAELDGSRPSMELTGDLRHVVIDDADRGCHEIALFHMINHLLLNQGSLLMTSIDPPSLWQVSMPDLASRLAKSIAIRVDPADEDTLSMLLVKQLADRGLEIAPVMQTYILRRIERTPMMIRSLVEHIDETSLTQKRPVSIPMIRDILEERF